MATKKQTDPASETVDATSKDSDAVEFHVLRNVSFTEYPAQGKRPGARKGTTVTLTQAQADAVNDAVPGPPALRRAS